MVMIKPSYIGPSKRSAAKADWQQAYGIGWFVYLYLIRIHAFYTSRRKSIPVVPAALFHMQYKCRLLLDLSVLVSRKSTEILGQTVVPRHKCQSCIPHSMFGGTFLPANVYVWSTHHALTRADHPVIYGYKTWWVIRFSVPPLYHHGSRTVSTPVLERLLSVV